MNQSKPFHELTLTDDFMFGCVMSTKEICKTFLESLLSISIREMSFPEVQKVLKDAPDYHGQRLDIFVRDVDGNAYNIEMQNRQEDDLLRRARVYGAAIDRKMLESGQNYAELPDTVVIFVNDFDFFKEGLAVYRVRKSIDEPEWNTRVEYNDGLHFIFLNTHFTKENAPPEITDFLRICRGLESRTDFGKTVSNRVADVRNDKIAEVRYLTIEEYANRRARDAKKEGREEGLAEGREEGLAEGRAKAIRQSAAVLRQSGMTSEEIAAVFEISAEELMKILETPDVG